MSSWEKMTHLNFVVILYKATQRSLAMSRRRTGPCEPESKGHRFDSARGPILLRFLGIYKTSSSFDKWSRNITLNIASCSFNVQVSSTFLYWRSFYQRMGAFISCSLWVKSLWFIMEYVVHDCVEWLFDNNSWWFRIPAVLPSHPFLIKPQLYISLFTPFWRDMQSDPGLLQFKPHNGFFI